MVSNSGIRYELRRVISKKDSFFWNDLIDRYHYLGSFLVCWNLRKFGVATVTVATFFYCEAGSLKNACITIPILTYDHVNK